MRRGLTLIELLIAITILVLVTAATMLVFRGITKAWQSGQLRTERYQQVRLLFDLFARELASSVANPRYPFIGKDATDPDRLRPDGAQDELFFVGTLPGRAGLVERGYWVTTDGDMMCHDQEPADGDYVGSGVDELCGTDVGEFDVTYFDGAQWLSSWDAREGGAQANAIPKAVHVVLTIGRQPSERFETVIHVPTG
jgi:prepilin-type N-terminal cleavage/methylation domain-containing protein